VSDATIHFLVPLVLGVLAGALVVGFAVHAARRVSSRARETADRLVEEATLQAEEKKQEGLLAVQEKFVTLEDEFEKREQDLDARESEMELRSAEVNRTSAKLDRDRRKLSRRESSIARSEKEAVRAEEEARRKNAEATRTLERIAGLSAGEAKAEMIAGIEQEARREGARLARKIEDECRENAEREASNLIVQAMEKVTLRELSETTVTYIELPSDEMKGRIIGREGRNIRALENVTGIDLIVDDTPQAILVSCFDPLRREIARVSIERLVEDGRIHPARIEEVVERVRSEVNSLVEETGSQAAFTLGLTELPSKLVRRIGRMKFHTNRGHNLLQHSLEVAQLAGYMAGETGAGVDIVHRAGLFHEIGRVDDSVSGHTVLASAELVGRYLDSEEVVHAIQALHPDVAAKTMEAILVHTANRISDNRPGACRDNLEVFIERLRRIESVAKEYEGVTDAYAVKAGKEIRVVVDAKVTDDEGAYSLSKKIARKLEQELTFPGQIKVNVIREIRAMKYAI
jgi:ribonuclease Y